jgi:hypothetical protein
MVQVTFESYGSVTRLALRMMRFSKVGTGKRASAGVETTKLKGLELQEARRNKASVRKVDLVTSLDLSKGRSAASSPTALEAG